uniref:Uncharacterized protein n=1 Tax=Arundo donax TaxID=35708 RepID=A0A0A9G858_ARUDO
MVPMSRMSMAIGLRDSLQSPSRYPTCNKQLFFSSSLALSVSINGKPNGGRGAAAAGDGAGVWRVGRRRAAGLLARLLQDPRRQDAAPEGALLVQLRRRREGAAAFTCGRRQRGPRTAPAPPPPQRRRRGPPAAPAGSRSSQGKEQVQGLLLWLHGSVVRGGVVVQH